VKNIFEHTFRNRHFRPPKIRGLGLGRTGKKFMDSGANSESVTTLFPHKNPPGCELSISAYRWLVISRIMHVMLEGIQWLFYGAFPECLRSASSSKYVTPQLQTKFGERAFSHAGPAAWNSLPPDIRAAASPAMFKKLHRMHSFNTAFSTC